MGDLFHSDSSQQSTSNNQVGVQGGVGVGANNSGTVVAGGSSIDRFTSQGQGNTINITTSDIEALHLADSVTANALAANTGVSLQAVNSSRQLASEALATLQTVHADEAATTNNALQASIDIAARAAPQSGAAQAEITGSQAADTNKQLIIAVAAAVITALAGYFYTKNK
jgi:hypothetical protein